MHHHYYHGTTTRKQLQLSKNLYDMTQTIKMEYTSELPERKTQLVWHLARLSNETPAKQALNHALKPYKRPVVSTKNNAWI